MTDEPYVRSFQVVRCLRCRHTWDDLDPDDYVCACIDTYGSRQVEVLSEGTTNTPSTIRVSA